MTQAQLYAAIKELSGILTIRKVEDEYRLSINPDYYQAHHGMGRAEAIAKGEAVAYYSDDREDILGTAKTMVAAMRPELQGNPPIIHL